MQLIGTAARAALCGALVGQMLVPGIAQAYMGPGLGLGALGVAFGVIGSILLGIGSVIWYPVKRLVRRLRKGRERPGPAPRQPDSDVPDA